MGERELIRLFLDKLLYNILEINWTTESQLMTVCTNVVLLFFTQIIKLTFEVLEIMSVFP